jgi:hypothetical protein
MAAADAVRIGRRSSADAAGPLWEFRDPDLGRGGLGGQTVFVAKRRAQLSIRRNAATARSDCRARRLARCRLSRLEGAEVEGKSERYCRAEGNGHPAPTKSGIFCRPQAFTN